MSTPWYTPAQVLIAAQDLYEENRSMADAVDLDYPQWERLSDASRVKWIQRASEHLSKKTPLDITKPLQLRAGLSVENVRLSDDGLNIIARVPAWQVDASFGIDGRSGDEDHPADLVYA